MSGFVLLGEINRTNTGHQSSHSWGNPKLWQAKKREYVIKLGSEVGGSQSIKWSNNLAYSIRKKFLENCFNWQNTEQNWMQKHSNGRMLPPHLYSTCYAQCKVLHFPLRISYRYNDNSNNNNLKKYVFEKIVKTYPKK